MPVTAQSWALEAKLARLEARAAELEREKAALEAFAAVAAHELLAPLIMTEAYATLIAERLDDSRHTASRRDLAILSREVARVRVLVETLLDDCAGADGRRDTAGSTWVRANASAPARARGARP